MPPRAAIAILLATTAVASADERVTTLTPSCADIDVERDMLTVELRERAKQQLARVLERAEQLVVDEGCMDRYQLSHEYAGERMVVRLAGPRGSRRARNVTVENLPRTYVRLVQSLLGDPSPAAAPVAPSAQRPAAPAVRVASAPPADISEPEPPVIQDDAVAGGEVVSPARIIYGQLGAGSHGRGFGVGYRRELERVAVDASFLSTGNDATGQTALGVELLYITEPSRKMTSYAGGGLSVAGQNDNDGLASGAGMRLEATAGIAFNRASALRWFAQLDVSLPLFTAHNHYDGTSSYSPTMTVSLGIGR